MIILISVLAGRRADGNSVPEMTYFCVERDDKPLLNQSIDQWAMIILIRSIIRRVRGLAAGFDRKQRSRRRRHRSDRGADDRRHYTLPSR